MVSIRDGAIPDPDNLGNPNSDPFAGTIYDAGREADPIDLPESDPDPTPTQGGDIRLGNAADNQTVNTDPVADTSTNSVGPGQSDGGLLSNVGIGIVGVVVALIGVLALR